MAAQRRLKSSVGLPRITEDCGGTYVVVDRPPCAAIRFRRLHKLLDEYRFDGRIVESGFLDAFHCYEILIEEVKFPGIKVREELCVTVTIELYMHDNMIESGNLLLLRIRRRETSISSWTTLRRKYLPW